MYVPQQFQLDEQAEIEALIAKNPFAVVISHDNNEQYISHVPINRFSDNKLCGHFSIKNPHSSIPSGSLSTAIFSGPHAYISPEFYQSDFNVPTWNYAAVHCCGKIHHIDDQDEAWDRLQELVQIYEGASGWQLPADDRIKQLIPALRFFSIDNPSFTAVAKFNQNKSSTDRSSVIASLHSCGKVDVAQYMERIINSVP